MKKQKYLNLRTVVLSLVLALVLVFINAAYFTTCQQAHTADKIDRGEDINLYEILSIYSLHCGICILGDFISPNAAIEQRGMTFKRDDVRYYFHDFTEDSEYLADRIKNRKLGRVTWRSYDNDLNAALAFNGGELIKFHHKNGVEYYGLKVDVNYNKPSKTNISLGAFTVTIYEQLFGKLQEYGWLHPYTMIWCTPTEKAIEKMIRERG